MLPNQSPFWIAQWELVVDAPLPFIACVAAAIGVIWFLVNWGYQRQIDGLKQQIATANQNIELFKNEVPALEKEIREVALSIQRHAPYVEIGAAAANAVTITSMLSRLTSDQFIPVLNRPPKRDQLVADDETLIDQTAAPNSWSLRVTPHGRPRPDEAF